MSQTTRLKFRGGGDPLEMSLVCSSLGEVRGSEGREVISRRSSSLVTGGADIHWLTMWMNEFPVLSGSDAVPWLLLWVPPTWSAMDFSTEQKGKCSWVLQESQLSSFSLWIPTLPTYTYKKMMPVIRVVGKIDRHRWEGRLLCHMCRIFGEPLSRLFFQLCILTVLMPGA